MEEFQTWKEKLESFLRNYFGACYDEKFSEKLGAIIFEQRFYFTDGYVGGYSSYYCHNTWNDATLENEADLEIFDLLFKIDIQNGADTSKIVNSLCVNGAFEAVKVRKKASLIFIRSLL